MADPVIPSGIRVQSILKGRTGLPEDRYVNTWAFRTAGLTTATEEDVQAANATVALFFTAVATNIGQGISSVLAATVDRPNCELRGYRLGQGIPREPVITPMNLGSLANSTSMPSEVAVVGTFYADRNLPRRRGRIYFGPLDTGTIAMDAQGISRPSTVVLTALAEQLDRMQANAAGVGLEWCVLSQVDAAMFPVTNGWVDNAWDTQRRGGEDPTARTLWSNVLP